MCSEAHSAIKPVTHPTQSAEHWLQGWITARGFNLNPNPLLFFKTESHYVVQAGFKLTKIHLPLPPSVRIKAVPHHTQL